MYGVRYGNSTENNSVKGRIDGSGGFAAILDRIEATKSKSEVLRVSI